MNVAQKKSLQIMKNVYFKGMGKLGSCCGLCCLIIQVTGLVWSSSQTQWQL